MFLEFAKNNETEILLISDKAMKEEIRRYPIRQIIILSAETDRRRVNALLRDEVEPEDVDNQMSVVMGMAEAAKRGDARAAGVLLKMLGEEVPQEDPGADTLKNARKLLGGIDSAID